MVFFKRLSRSRSRSNSQSYVDNTYDSRHDSKHYDDSPAYAHSEPPRDRAFPVGQGGEDYDHPPASAHSEKGPRIGHGNTDAFDKEVDMYSRRDRPVEVPTQQQQGGGAFGGGQGYRENLADRTRGGASNGYDAPPKSDTAAPNLLIEAFNQAVRPYSDRIENLESEIADLRAYIASLERQQNEVHAWIDKRGLRPDVPPGIAQIMDSASHASSPTHAAATLNAQLDRKITIVNFDLHRLQDDLNDSLPTPSFSACMLKFLPDISRLSSLPSGPRYAFDLLLKLGGNLNSHGGLENGDEDDILERKAFYGRLDEAMVDVVKGRFREEGGGWGVQREIKRIEKTGAYLRNWGVEPYFPQTLDVMRDGGGGGGGGSGMQGSAGQAVPGGNAPDYA